MELGLRAMAGLVEPDATAAAPTIDGAQTGPARTGRERGNGGATAFGNDTLH